VFQWSAGIVPADLFQVDFRKGFKMERVPAKKSCSCKNCGERIFRDEASYVGLYHGKRSIRESVYCRFCFEDGKAAAHLASLGSPVLSAEQNSERERETFAAYQAAGVAHLYAVETEAKPEPCPHYEDNQGFCHRCGILMNEDFAYHAGLHPEQTKNSQKWEREEWARIESQMMHGE